MDFIKCEYPSQQFCVIHIHLNVCNFLLCGMSFDLSALKGVYRICSTCSLDRLTDYLGKVHLDLSDLIKCHFTELSGIILCFNDYINSIFDSLFKNIISRDKNIDRGREN